MALSEARPTFPAIGKIGRLSALMCWVVAVGGALAELVLIWVWLSPSWIETLVAPRLGLTGYPLGLDGATRLAGFALSMLPMALLFYLLGQAFQLFDAFRVGDVFTAAAPVRLRRIGAALVLLAAVRPLVGMVLTGLLTMANPPNQRVLALAVSLDDYLIAALGGLVLVIGHVMLEATRLADDNRTIV